jgi:cytosine/adenosine deaminase-related metal-dependent hydrolase
MSSVLIKDGTIITLDSRRRIIRDGAILLEDGLIKQVGRLTDIKPPRQTEFEINAHGMAVLPGLVDAHVHLAQALIRGCADDTSLIDWLQKFVWPLQGNFDAQDGQASAELCMLEMIKSGTTTFLESLLHSRYGFDGISESVERSGMRGVLSKTVMSLPGYGSERSIMHPGMVEDGEKCLREVESHFRRWNRKADDRIRVWYGARSLGGCTPEVYRQIAVNANRLGTGVTMHLSEVQEDVQYAKKEFGKLPAEFMDEVGLLGSNVVFAHGVCLTENEWSILGRRGAHVAHCPSSNMKLASGIARVPEMVKAGVNVGLGCDGGPSNNCYDMIREMKAASLLQKASTMDPLAMNAMSVLEMATIRGASALGLQSQVGSIEVGKKGDLIVVNLKKPHLTPTFDTASSIVYAAMGSDVETCIVDGKIVMENRVVKTLDEEKVIREANDRAARLLERTGLSVVKN